MSSFEEFCESVGVPLRRGPAANAYRLARNFEDLRIATGEHLALHAVGIMRALPLARRGSLILRAMKSVSKEKWNDYCRINSQAFCCCAMVDLCSVREFFKEAERWPELKSLLDQAFIMACVYLGDNIRMDREGVATGRGNRTTNGSSGSSRAVCQEQLSRIMEIEGIDVRRIDKVRFITSASMHESYLEPFFLIEEYDRIKKAHP